MSCERCGSPSQGRLCADCEQMDRVERNNKHMMNDGGSVADTAEVIQGRLGWESGDISEADPSNLKPHPKNAEIYGDTDDVDDLDATFKESVAEKGVLEPLVITNGKEIISGHRRWLAAKDADLGSVPVRYSEFDDELAEREALIEFNRQREKNPAQIVNEFDEIVDIEEARAKENMSKGGKGERVGNVSNPSEDEPTAVRDRAAEKVNADVSGRTLEKGKKVKDKAESDDEPEPVREAAKEAWDGLQSGDESFNSAYESVRDTERELESDGGDDSDDGSDIDQFVSQETDEWSSPKGLVEPLDDAVGGFDLDPCSGAEQSPFAGAVYTEDDDGLAQEWFGDVWVNPPYSAMAAWTEKAVAEAQRNAVDSVLYLCKGDSSTDWWQAGMAEAVAVGTIDHRLKFGDGENSAPFASHVLVFGDVGDDVIDALAEHGHVLQAVDGGEADG